jgi:hypothetical protein
MISRIFNVILFIVALIYVLFMDLTWLIRKFLTVALWFILNTIDLVLIIPLGLVWLFTGKNYIYKLEYWVNEKTGIFNSMYEKEN